ncbi:C-type lectin protein [Fowlpox virus]|uniref:Putative C-type lectin protein FPV008/FPV253 n=2 Tax=Fowlpox virus TaxID=10261 RepID=V008_FOWPN|nr:C-type lectin protein [Fowlpox virus]NP_039216.1 C-type lectin protein [Fowlpox virus]P14370.1 RecName: Full=Putative C-type lectin protein FPV008/FPV253; AltName: Full=BamHI-ORF2 [Fowlpox virus strain NVSL]UNS14178.1 ALPV-014 [Albatrosspox virus]WPD90959.1 C-type lectin family protein [Avipoxvirus sp.]CAE52554.1 putative C-type lectin [Fowlpox virus isolate HP-438/Munich]AAF44607.1 ORF FPV008 C-type lectin gene family protein [Fowlpox virus]AAF44608.1 ORF FPV253 C-type lectin gene family
MPILLKKQVSEVSCYAITVLGILCLILFTILVVVTCKWYYAFPYFSKVCPDEWIGYNSKCYYFTINETNWNDSKKLCDVMDSSLIRFDNIETLNFVSRYGKGSYWIDINQNRKIPGINFSLYYEQGVNDICLLFDTSNIIEMSCIFHERTICVKEDRYTHWYTEYMR